MHIACRNEHTEGRVRTLTLESSLYVHNALVNTSYRWVGLVLNSSRGQKTVVTNMFLRRQ